MWTMPTAAPTPRAASIASHQLAPPDVMTQYTTPLRGTTPPTDRSKPPATTTSSWPSATISSTQASEATFTNVR
jgi:hypothetical protein